MRRSLFLRCGCGFGFRRRRRWSNGGDFVLLDEYISIVGFDFEHVLFVGHDHAVEFFPVFQADFVGARRVSQGCERQNCRRKEKGAALGGDTHRKSIPPAKAARNFYAPGGVRRATSASSVRMRLTRRPSSWSAARRRARNGSGNCALVCWSASASATLGRWAGGVMLARGEAFAVKSGVAAQAAAHAVHFAVQIG